MFGVAEDRVAVLHNSQPLTWKRLHAGCVSTLSNNLEPLNIQTCGNNGEWHMFQHPILPQTAT